MRRIIAVLSIVLPLFAGCQAALFGPEPAPPSFAVDEINDVLRETGIDFATFAPVRLSIGVRSDSSQTRAVADASPVIVRLADGSDETLFIAAVDDGGSVTGEVLVPVETDAVTLTLDSPDFETRQVTIDDPAAYEEINRVLAVKGSPDDKIDNDRDADGISDYYDAFPDDPELAFERSIPTSGTLTIAFEDNYPDLGDGDYNDFIANYRIVEYRNAKNSLVEIRGEAEAVARGAGFNHEFGIVVDVPGLTGDAEIIYRDGNGDLVGTTTQAFDGAARLVLFGSTRDAFTREPGYDGMDNIDPTAPASLGYSTSFSLSYMDSKTSTPVDAWTPYNPYLLVSNTNLDYRPDVHLIGKAPLADSENPDPDTDFRDADGYPRALLVPNDWLWPRERTHIELAYPNFASWRASNGKSDTDWYFYPDPDHVMPE